MDSGHMNLICDTKQDLVISIHTSLVKSRRILALSIWCAVRNNILARILPEYRACSLLFQSVDTMAQESTTMAVCDSINLVSSHDLFSAQWNTIVILTFTRPPDIWVITYDDGFIIWCSHRRTWRNLISFTSSSNVSIRYNIIAFMRLVVQPLQMMMMMTMTTTMDDDDNDNNNKNNYNNNQRLNQFIYEKVSTHKRSKFSHICYSPSAMEESRLEHSIDLQLVKTVPQGESARKHRHISVPSRRRTWRSTVRIWLKIASSQSQFQQAEVSLRWAQRFLKRKRLALRTPKSRHWGQTSVKGIDVDNYFGLLNDRVSAWGLWEKPGNIVNMDESDWGKDEQCKYFHALMHCLGDKLTGTLVILPGLICWLSPLHVEYASDMPLVFHLFCPDTFFRLIM